jgi:hypothetical protein
MLAICSDLDKTPSLDVYLDIMKFLNTGDQTSMGQGVSLEVGNTIYFDMPNDQFSYWNTDDHGRNIVNQLIESGYIDCIHSFGDFATSEKDIDRALSELSKLKRKISVWIDHAQARTNLGPDIMLGEGDVKTSDVYHSDKTIAYGIKYVWLGRVTSIIGQNTSRSFSHLLNAGFLRKSLTTILKEIIKIILAKLKSAKYSLHACNQLMTDSVLRDGSKVKEFMRCNPHWGGVSHGDNAKGIAGALTRKVLDNLVAKNGISIIYTHLGKIDDVSCPFAKQTVNAFRLLKEYELKGKVLVTTTSRLLAYNNMLQTIRIENKPDKKQINLLWDGDLHDLDGLSMLLDDDIADVQVTINGIPNKELEFIEMSDAGTRIITCKWHRLRYPHLGIERS